jgi:hypothetical protein
MKLVMVESPYAGDIEINLQYARACMADCLKFDEAPFASHLLYTQEGILNDNVPSERSLGIRCNLAWQEAADYIVFYTDLGISDGMRDALICAIKTDKQVIFRRLPKWK